MVKLADFGWAVKLEPGSSNKEDPSLGPSQCRSTYCGTMDYLSPEMSRLQGGDGSYDESIDTYAMGVLMYELITGVLPSKVAKWAGEEGAAGGGGDAAGGETPMYSASTAGAGAGGAGGDGGGEGACPTVCVLPSEAMSEEARDLLSRILVADPKQRISIQDVLRHPWLRDTDEGKKAAATAEKAAAKGKKETVVGAVVVAAAKTAAAVAAAVAAVAAPVASPEEKEAEKGVESAEEGGVVGGGVLTAAASAAGKVMALTVGGGAAGEVDGETITAIPLMDVVPLQGECKADDPQV
jgi:hypothetical protein